MKKQKLYLIHALRIDGSLWHYIGITAKENPQERLEEHLRNTTRKAYTWGLKHAIAIQFWQLMAHASVDHEKALQALDEQTVRDFICPACRKQRHQTISEKGHPFFTDTPSLLANVQRKPSGNALGDG